MKQTTLLKNRAQVITGVSKDETQTAEKRLRKDSPSSASQENANQNFFNISSHTGQNGQD